MHNCLLEANLFWALAAFGNISVAKYESLLYMYTYSQYSFIYHCSERGGIPLLRVYAGQYDLQNIIAKHVEILRLHCLFAQYSRV